MKTRTILVAAIAVAALAALPSGATVYTWTGGVGSGSNWYDTGNWDANGVPRVGASTQLGTSTDGNTVIFDSETAVGGYIHPGNISLGSSWTVPNRNPNIELRNGTLNTGTGINWGWNGDTFTVGDDNATTLAVLNLVNMSNLNRDPNGTKNYVAKTDGTINVNTSLSKWADNTSGGKAATVQLLGGAMTVNGTINANFTNGAQNYVSFEDNGSTFTAKFGGQLGSLSDVQANIGSGLSFRSTTGTDPVATDNGDNTFTVALIPEPATLSMLGFVGLALLARRRFRR